MKILKRILIGLLALIVLFLVVALFAPKNNTTIRSVDINAPQGKVFTWLNSTQMHDKWSPWTDADPNIKITFDGPATGVGNRSCWNGNDQVGEGCQTIMSMTDSSQVVTLINFKRPFESKAEAILDVKPITPTSTKVTWTMKSNSPFPMNALNLFVDFIGPSFELGLGRLKAFCEK